MVTCTVPDMPAGRYTVSASAAGGDQLQLCCSLATGLGYVAYEQRWLKTCMPGSTELHMHGGCTPKFLVASPLH